jgi:4-diphosphocytidyl-2-C-methyl-D-erythritol kinase
MLLRANFLSFFNCADQLASLFHTVTIFDTLVISRSEDGASSDAFSCTHGQLMKEQDNLVTRALRLMREKTNLPVYFDVNLIKRIPLQAGLGGGSSNAATAMFAFNALCSYPATTAQLAEWSVELGVDVPFFFSNGCAFCEGRGDEVRQIDGLLADSTNIQVDMIKPR